jgi:hypothetical protein
MSHQPLIKICQHGTDGFGHQLEGTLILMALSINKRAEYQYHHIKEYTFEHSNFNKDLLEQYLRKALAEMALLDPVDPSPTHNYRLVYNEQRHFQMIPHSDIDYRNRIYFYDGVGSGWHLPMNFQMPRDLFPALSTLRTAFVEKNPYLPSPSYDTQRVNVCCHIRLGDAVGSRPLDNENLYNVVKYFQKDSKYNIIVHSNGNVDHLQAEHTRLCDSTTDVLQILSDFIHADIFIMAVSSLSIAAHLLAKESQVVICPDGGACTFRHRIQEKCIPCSQVLQHGI